MKMFLTKRESKMEDVIATYKCVKEYVQREFLGNKVVAFVPNKFYKSKNGIIIDERGNQHFTHVLLTKGYIDEVKTDVPEYYYVEMEGDGSCRFVVKSAKWGQKTTDELCRMTNGNMFFKKEDAEAHAAYLDSSTLRNLMTDAESKKDIREDELADAAE